MRRQRDPRARVALAALLMVAGGAWVAAQAVPDVADLRTALSARFDIVPLQQGVALVPQDPDAGFSVIQVVGGTVSVDGEPLTGGELSARLGADAAAVVQASYLDAAGLAALVSPGETAAPAPPPAPAPPVPPAPPAPPDRPRQDDRDSRDRVRVGGPVFVDDDERVPGDAVAIFGPSRIDGSVGGDAVTIFGSARIDGEVDGDAVVVMGSLSLGPDAVVRGETTVVGGTIAREPGAQLLGGVNEVGALGFGGFNGIGPRVFDRRGFFNVFDGVRGGLGSLASTVVRGLLLVLIGLIAVAVARPSVERIADQGRGEMVRSGLIGLLAEALFVPVLVVTLVVLAVSVVGIPLIALAPFAVLFVVVLMLAGFSGVAYAVGQAVSERLGGRGLSPYLAVACGVLAILAVTLLARLAEFGVGFLGLPLRALGFVVEYLAWTIGFGAAIMALVEWRRHRRVPAVPPPPPPVPGEA